MRLKLINIDTSTEVNIPLLGNKISAGFPNAADGYIERTIDLNKEFIKNKASTFVMQVEGESMKGACIKDGDYLIVDRSDVPRDKKIVVCYIDGEFTVKRIKIEKDVIWLMPENEEYKPIRVDKDNNFIIWGVVAHSIKSHH